MYKCKSTTACLECVLTRRTGRQGPPHGSVPFLLRTVVGDRLCLAERAKTEYEMQSMSPDQAEAYTARNGGRWDEAANTVTDMAEHLNSLQNVLMEAVL